MWRGEQDWGVTSDPMPDVDQARAGWHPRLMDYAAGHSAATRHTGWRVRVELPSHRQAVELARRLPAEGRSVIRRWKCLIIGAANQDEARALAEVIARKAPAGASVSAQANALAPFPGSRPWIADIPYYLGG